MLYVCIYIAGLTEEERKRALAKRRREERKKQRELELKAQQEKGKSYTSPSITRNGFILSFYNIIYRRVHMTKLSNLCFSLLSFLSAKSQQNKGQRRRPVKPDPDPDGKLLAEV
jgi:hypothetical protein